MRWGRVVVGALPSRGWGTIASLIPRHNHHSCNCPNDSSNLSHFRIIVYRALLWFCETHCIPFLNHTVVLILLDTKRLTVATIVNDFEGLTWIAIMSAYKFYAFSQLHRHKTPWHRKCNGIISRG